MWHTQGFALPSLTTFNSAKFDRPTGLLVSCGHDECFYWQNQLWLTARCSRRGCHSRWRYPIHARSRCAASGTEQERVASPLSLQRSPYRSGRRANRGAVAAVTSSSRRPATTWPASNRKSSTTVQLGRDVAMERTTATVEHSSPCCSCSLLW